MRTMVLSINTVKAYALASVAIAAGIYAGFTSADWSWLSRSGCLLVVIGILLTSSQIIEHNRSLRQRRMNWEARMRHEFRSGTHRASRSNHDWAGEMDLRELAGSRTREEDTWEVEGHGLYLLLLGTLLWGFGDLVGGFFFG